MKCIKLLSIVVVLFGFIKIGSAQTMEDVVNAQTKGRNLMADGNLDEAIAEFERCIEIAIQVGEEAEFIQVEIESALPNLYFQKVSKIPRTEFQALLEAFNATVEVAVKYNDTRTKENAERQIPPIYYAIGLAAYSSQNYEGAIENFDEAIARNPNIAGAYFIKGLICETITKDEHCMDENYKLAIEKGKEFRTLVADNAQRSQAAQQRLRTYHYNSGVSALRTQKWDDAIVSFTKSLEADDNNFEALLGMVLSYNGKKSWDDAIAYSEKALQIRENAYEVFYELGLSYKGKNDKAKACENLRKVTSGPRLENAKHEINVVLKCN